MFATIQQEIAAPTTIPPPSPPVTILVDPRGAFVQLSHDGRVRGPAASTGATCAAAAAVWTRAAKKTECPAAIEAGGAETPAVIPDADDAVSVPAHSDEWSSAERPWHIVSAAKRLWTRGANSVDVFRQEARAAADTERCAL
ncbi:hypothetical protein A1Q1_01572 [Trichosporon asahii var. asahii CBS 2479]|uniref:Uncharacterized protein n=1 Tax=Trichosporon asahii var. asahii (strain ATCC 90039 / CBS 2479 / JCM 2466 / KCTC 7840 / NBRC 103889/ NCYC 2677 / UAMH 7654) TaxID=1186058 RepID=J4UDV8_TRIAS|nr:hypothetical protein A1Q1_01572 [Trichosporon asahii var. asahii CBS 2479]EJT49370.1 hypothetical protein A1Q1_01572 [Trichosporon asahii var. asahii CBS 2479]